MKFWRKSKYYATIQRQKHTKSRQAQDTEALSSESIPNPSKYEAQAAAITLGRLGTLAD
jgi:hypothetical protein